MEGRDGERVEEGKGECGGRGGRDAGSPGRARGQSRTADRPTISHPIFTSQHQIGRYMVEVWKAVGMDMERVQFLNCSEEINAR